VNLYFGRHPDDHDEICSTVENWEDAAGVMAMVCLVAAEGPNGFGQEELDTALVGASPPEAVLMVLGAVARLVRRAYPDMQIG